MSGIFEAFDPAEEEPFTPAEAPPKYGFSVGTMLTRTPGARNETFWAGRKAGLAGTDWGLHQTNYENSIRDSLATGLKERGIEAPHYDFARERVARRMLAAGGYLTADLRKGLEDADRFWGLVAAERKRDPKFAADLGDVADDASVSALAHRRRDQDESTANAIYDDSTGMGKVAWWAGNLSSATNDPLSYIGGGAGASTKAVTALTRIVSAALRGAATNAAATVVLEPLTQADAKGRGQERGAAEIATDVALSAAFGGILGAGERGLAEALSRPASGRAAVKAAVDAIGPENLTPDAKAAVHAVTRELDTVESNPFTHGPDGDRTHAQRLTTAVAAMEADLPTPDFATVSRLPVEGRITSGFGLRKRPRAGASANHMGIDIAAPANSPVSVTGGGEVIFAGPDGGNGNIVRVDHGDGVITSYAHLNSIDVKPGDHIGVGDRVGRVGSTGISTGNHTHYAVKVNGEFVDPMTAHIPGGHTVPGEVGNQVRHSAPPEYAAMKMEFDDAPTLSARAPDDEISLSLPDRQKATEEDVRARITQDIATYDGDMGDAAIALLDQDDRAPYSNVEARRKAILGRAHAMMEGTLARHRRRVTGQVRDPAGLEAIARERFGEDSGSLTARELADGFEQASEMLRQRFNRAGGNIGKMDNWGLPQMHSAAKVRAVPYETWREAVKLDRSRMVNEAGEPLTPQELEGALRSTYDAIRTEGWSRREPGSAGGKKLANQRAERRFLHFADADAWLDYQRQYGSGSPFDAMMGHLAGMSRDIALMEVLGPNPRATVRWLQDSILQSAALGDGSKLGSANAAAKTLEDVLDVLDGSAAIPVRPGLAAAGGAVRSTLSSAQLGSAALSAFTDVGFQFTTREFNGLPVVGSLTGYFKLFRPYMSKDQKLAIRLGLIAHEASAMASAQNRYIGESVGPEIASRLADGVLRVSGLSPWTQAGRWAFGLEFLGHLADQSEKPFSKLHPSFRGVLERYGIGSDEWATIRKTPHYEREGLLGTATFLRPQDIADEALGDRVLEMISTEMDFAVPSVTPRGRAAMSIGEPGTIAGEAVKSALLYKSFGVSLLYTHGRRLMQQQRFSRAKYAASLFISTTLAAAIVLQMKEIRSGKDPRPMKDPAFWGSAVLQGGGLGIFGDFLQGTESRAGGGLAETVAGPVVSAAADAADLTLVNATKAVMGDETDVGHDAARMLRRYTPGGTNWYTRLAFERFVLDEINRQIDPDYDETFDRMEKFAEDRGTDYWWQPGDHEADRSANWANALEDAPD